MKLLIQGRPTGAGVNQDLIREAANYYVSILMDEDVSRINDIAVRINLIPNLQRDFNGVAFCTWVDCPLRPNQFLVEIDSSLGYKTTLISLAHEFTHVKQMAFGQKQESLDGTTTRWCGMLVRPDLHYYDLPWEVEAHGREYGLYDRFANMGVEIEPATIFDNEKILAVAGTGILN